MLGLRFAIARVAAAEPGPVIVAFGDSLFAGYGLPNKDSFPARLEARLHKEGIDARIINAGVSGDTTADGLARVGWAMADKPKVVLLELGGNDALRCLSPQRARANLDAMIRKFRAGGARVLLIGMIAPRNCGQSYQRRFDRIYPALARKDHVPLYPFFLAGVALNPKLTQADGIHPNKAGIRVLVDRVGPWVRRHLQGGPA